MGPGSLQWPWGHGVGMSVVQEAQLPREVYQDTPEDIAALKQSAKQIAEMKKRQ